MIDRMAITSPSVSAFTMVARPTRPKKFSAVGVNQRVMSSLSADANAFAYVGRSAAIRSYFLSTVFTVHDRGEPHRAVAWGGTAYNFGPLPDRLQLYFDTTIKYRAILKQENADIILSNHVSFDDAVAKMAALKDRKPGEPNPFVVGPDAVQRFLTVLGECALATKASIGDDTPGR